MRKRSVTTHFSAEQYLAMEDVSETKHEFYDGKIYDMARGTPDHSLISVNVLAALARALESTPCRVFGSNMRILVEDEGLYTYPDVSVVCGKLQFAPKSKSTLTNPLVLVEVMSPSTRAYDRGQKFKLYKKIRSLQELVLVESDRAHVEVLRRIPRGQWAIDIYNGLDAVAVLKSIECEIPLRQIYAKVTWLE